MSNTHHQPESDRTGSPEVPDEVLRLHEFQRLADPANGLEAVPAEAAARAALALAQQLGRSADALQAGVWLARHLYHLGQHADALAQIEQVLTDAPELGAPALRAEALRIAAVVACELARFDRAIDAAQSMMQLATVLGDAGTSLNAAFTQAACHQRMGDAWQSERLLSRALLEHGADGPDGAVLTVANALCAACTDLAYQLRGCEASEERQAVIARGLAAGSRAMAVAERMGNPVYIAVLQINLAELMIGGGDIVEAERLIAQALAVVRQQGLTGYEHGIGMLHADAVLRQGQAEQACLLIEELLAQREGIPPAIMARAHEVAMRACKATGRYQRALEHFEAAERIERQSMTAQLRMQSTLLVTRSEEQRARHEALSHQNRAAQLQLEVERDPLTGLGNRRHLTRCVAELLREFAPAARPLALAVIDIDHFKQVNDRHGHAAGDAVLVNLAAQMRACMRQDDVLVRQGGEEFVIVLPDATLAQAQTICERLRERVQRQAVVLPDGSNINVTISIGLAAAPPYVLRDLAEKADMALYEAKRSGRNRLCLAPAGA